MTSTDHYLTGNVRGTKFYGTATPGGFNGDGSTLTSLTRTNIAAGTANHVLINGGTGFVSSELRLAPVRSGLGSITSGLVVPYTHWDNFVGAVRPTDGQAVDAVMPAIVTGTTGAFNPIGASIAPVANTLVMRDAAGNISGAGNTTVQQSGSLATTVNITGPSTTYIVSAYARTIPGSSTGIVTLVSEVGFSGVFTIETLLAVIELNDTSVHGSLRSVSRVKYTNEVAPPNSWVSPALMENHKSLEAAISTASVSLLTSGSNLVIQVNGVAGITLDWTGQIRIVYERTLTV